MQTGKIVAWMRKGGDRVNRGDIIFRLETEKVTFDVEAEADGILSNVLVEAVMRFPSGQPSPLFFNPGRKLLSFP